MEPVSKIVMEIIAAAEYDKQVDVVLL